MGLDWTLTDAELKASMSPSVSFTSNYVYHLITALLSCMSFYAFDSGTRPIKHTHNTPRQ